MGRVRSKNTGPEITVRRLVHGMGYRYALHAKDLPGRPDLVFRSRQKIILVHGCFWHAHRGCPNHRIPKSRVDFWTSKIEGNASRDKRQRLALRKLGYRVMVVWECEIKETAKLIRRLSRFLEGER